MSELQALPILKFKSPVRPAQSRGREGRMEWIAIDKLFIDRAYQRSVAWVGEANIRRVAEEFHWSLFSPLVVSAREGGIYAIIDGQHRAIAAKMHGGIDKLPCLVVHATPAEEARAFAVINGHVSKVATQFLFRARLASGESLAAAANRAAEAAGVRILTYPVGRGDLKPNETIACGTVEKRVSLFGEELVADALKLIMASSNGANFLGAAWISAFCDVLNLNPLWRQRLGDAAAALSQADLALLLEQAKSKVGFGGDNSVRARLAPLITSALAAVLGDGGGQAPQKHQPRVGRRFTEHKPLNPEGVKGLKPDHPAVSEKRTLFPTTVVSPAESPALLVSGKHSRKLGEIVRKGEWKGFPIYQLSLEERATCPDDCSIYNLCYGNAMPFARRHKHDATLVPALKKELKALQAKHRRGFVVRLHVLGDFFSVEYVRQWAQWLIEFPALHVFGYTARTPESDIGAVIKWLTKSQWNRFAIRFSAAESKPQGATTIWRKPEEAKVAEGIVCPAQTEASACCATCGLCWSDAARDQTIVFVGHGGVGSPPGIKHARKSAPAQKPEEVRPDAASQRAIIQSMVREDRAPAPPGTGKISERDLIEQHLKSKGVRRFGTDETGDPVHLLNWLERVCGRSAKRRTQGGSNRIPYVVDGKFYDAKGFIALVNEERAKRKMKPLTIGEAA